MMIKLCHSSRITMIHYDSKTYYSLITCHKYLSIFYRTNNLLGSIQIIRSFRFRALSRFIKPLLRSVCRSNRLRLRTCRCPDPLNLRQDSDRGNLRQCPWTVRSHYRHYSSWQGRMISDIQIDIIQLYLNKSLLINHTVHENIRAPTVPAMGPPKVAGP